MRLFCTLVLLGSGCVDRSLVEVPSDDFTGRPDGEFEPEPLIADVCETLSWDVLPDSKNVDLSVVSTPSGTTVLSVPKDGGAVRGFRLDQRGQLFDRDLIAVRDERNYTGVSAAMADGRLVVASQVGDKVLVDIIRDDLGEKHTLGEFSGTLVTDAPVIAAGATKFALVGGSAGLTAAGFVGGNWDAAQPLELSKHEVVSMAAMPYLDDAIVAWSESDRTCHLQQLSTREEAVYKFGCNDLRIVTNGSNSATLVFADEGQVYSSAVQIKDGIHVATPIGLGFGASPRVTHDGDKFWVSYIDVHGDVIVGFLDAAGQLHSRSLPDVRPEIGDAYDLAANGSGALVVNVGDAAFSALRVCAKPQ